MNNRSVGDRGSETSRPIDMINQLQTAGSSFSNSLLLVKEFPAHIVPQSEGLIQCSQQLQLNPDPDNPAVILTA
jgi:hypothetical protein